jgi:hypothetical protein
MQTEQAREMLVYRVEWAEGGGFYNGRSYDAARSLIDYEQPVDRHPAPMEDSRFLDDFEAKGWRRNDVEHLTCAGPSNRSGVCATGSTMTRGFNACMTLDAFFASTA